MVLLNRNELCELCHIVLHRDDLQHNTAEISFPQTVELQYVELSASNAGKSLQLGSLQVYGRMGDCEAAQTFIELTDGPKELGSCPELLDANSLHTERLSIRGDFDEVPRKLSSRAQEHPIPSESLLPLQGLPRMFLQALDPIARYWQAVGMSFSAKWPECMWHCHGDETFSPLIGLANDLIHVLTECTSASSLSLMMLERLKARLKLESSDNTDQALPSQIGELDTHLFVRVVVSWMGLSAATRQAEKRADEFCLFALAAAVVLCSSKATAALFMRYGGVARCSQILSEHQNVPHSPYIRYTTAILAMLAECSTEAVTEVVMQDKQPATALRTQSPAPEQRIQNDAPAPGAEASPAATVGEIHAVDPELQPPAWEPPPPGFVVPGFGRVDPRELANSAHLPRAPKLEGSAARRADSAHARGDAEQHNSVDPSSARNGQTGQRPVHEQQVPDRGAHSPDAQDGDHQGGSADRATKERQGDSGSEGVQPGVHGDKTPGQGQGQSSAGAAPPGVDTQHSGMASYSSDATSSLLGHTPSPEHSTGNNMEQALGHSEQDSPDIAVADTEAVHAAEADIESAERGSPDNIQNDASKEASVDDQAMAENAADVAMEDASPPADVPDTEEAEAVPDEEENTERAAADLPKDDNHSSEPIDTNHVGEPVDVPMGDSSGEAKASDAAVEDAPDDNTTNGAISKQGEHEDVAQGSPIDQSDEQDAPREDSDAVMRDADDEGGGADAQEPSAPPNTNGAAQPIEDVDAKPDEAGEGEDGESGDKGDEVPVEPQGEGGEGVPRNHSHDEEPNGSRKRERDDESEAHVQQEDASPAKKSREQDIDAPANERPTETRKRLERRKRVCTGPTAAATAAAIRIAAGEEPPAVPEQRPVLIGAAVADHLKPLPQLLCTALDAPHARDTLALGSRFLQHLALQEAIEVFEACTETLIGKVQQGAIGFSDADEGILRVARALGDVCSCIEALCALPPRTWWREASHAMLKKLPQIPAGDAAAFRCVAKRGVLLRCMQMILLPPMIVNAIVEAGSALAAKERQSLERRLGTHFHTPLRGFFMTLFRTTEGFTLLCNDPDTCQQLSAALSTPATHASDETPLLPRTLPTASAPENTLATQLAFLATAKYAWDSVAGTAAGTPTAMHAMHTLLHLTEDDEMCQMLSRVLLVTPAAQEWLQGTVLDSIAMDLMCQSPQAIDAQIGIECPQQLRDRIKELSDPQNTPQIPVEAPFAPSVLHALCSQSLAMYASSWARFLCLHESPIALSLRYKCSQEDAQAVQSPQPQHSLLHSQCRARQIQWMWECVSCLCTHQADGVSSVLDILDRSLPPLTASSLEGLPQLQVDWASNVPLCHGNDPAFQSLRRSAGARGRVSSALMLMSAALSDVPDGVVTPVLAVTHSHAGGGLGRGVGILMRAVAVAVTWMHSLRSANQRTLMLADAYNLSDIAGDVAEAMALLQHACGALCGAVGALLKVPSRRLGVQGTGAMHVRWRGVCHMLLAAYNVVHWMPDNLRSLLRPPSEVTAALTTRHTIVATLQLWLTVQHPICPLQHALCAGIGRGASPVDDISAAAGETGSVKAWVPPAAQTSILCMLGDICAKAWPSSRSHTDRKLSEILPFGELRAAVAAASPPLAREIQALVHSCSVSHCKLLQAAFARFLPRLLSCSESMGTWLLSPILFDLKSLVGSGTTHLQVHRVHALLKTTVPMLYCPLFKAHMREQKFEELLCDVLHRSVGAWTEPSISDEHCVALQAVCQVVVDALKIMCDVKVSMAPGETVAERARTDLPASKHLLLVVCTLLECLPFLEGSSDAAVNILSELIKGTAAPHIVNAVRKGAQAAAQAFTAEERDALGVSTLAIATTGTSPLIYLADQLTKRADTLRTHGKFVSTMPACATASELMRHLDTVPETADAASTSDRTAQEIITQRYAAAAAAGSVAPASASATSPSRDSSNGLAATHTAAAAPSLAVPLDVVGPLTLAHEADMSRFVEYAQLREMPAAAGTALEEITASSSRAPQLESLMPRTLDTPSWRSSGPNRIGADFSGADTSSRKQPKQSIDHYLLKPSMLPDTAMDVKPVVPVSGPSAVGVKEEFMGPGAAVELKPRADSADLYSDIMTTGLHSSHVTRSATAVRSSKTVRNVAGSSAATRVSKGTAESPSRATRTPAAPGNAQPAGGAAANNPTDPAPPNSNSVAKSSPVSSHSGPKTSNSESGASIRRARALAMAGVLPASMRPDMPDVATANASRPTSTAHTAAAAPGQQSESPSVPFTVPNSMPTATDPAAGGSNGASITQKDGQGSHMIGRMASERQSTQASTRGTTPDPASGGAPPTQHARDVYSRSVPLPPPPAGSTQKTDTGGGAATTVPSQPSSGQALPPPPIPGPPSTSGVPSQALPPSPAQTSAQVPASQGPEGVLPGPPGAAPAAAAGHGMGAPTLQGMQDLLKDPAKLRQLLSDPRWAAFFSAKLKSKLKPGS